MVMVNECGGPDVLTVADREDLQPGPGQLLVDVAAAGVNYMDIYQREGRPPYGRDLPFVPGSEGAGTVAALGPGAEGFAVGDRVAWAGAPGCYAEQAVVPAASAVSIPDGIETTLAAAVMLQGITAHYLCHSTYPVTPGDTVAVHAAAGGVGLLLTQMIKDLGGTVVATTSSTVKAALAKEMGADNAATYEEFPAVVREVTGGRGADVVFDGVGKATFDASLSALRPRGMMVLFGGSSGQVPPFDLQRLNSGGSLFVTRPTLAHYTADRTELIWRASDIFEAITKATLRVRGGAEYPLAAARQAHEDLSARRTTGKLILIP